jgi:hypothetical protein
MSRYFMKNVPLLHKDGVSIPAEKYSLLLVKPRMSAEGFPASSSWTMK